MALPVRLPLAQFPPLHLRSRPKLLLFLSTPNLPSASQTLSLHRRRRRRRYPARPLASVGKEETELRVASNEQQDASPDDLEYIQQIKRVIELLEKNRDMTIGEIKLTIMIEDSRDDERKRLLGIDDPDEITRDDLAAVLQDVADGRVPDNRVALKLLAMEMNEWPDIEVEAQKKIKPSKSLYAKVTDTGIDPEEAAKRLNIDWDSAVDIEPGDDSDDIEVPPAMGYGALYLVTALPLLIGISVVLILFYNSLQ